MRKKFKLNKIIGSIMAIMCVGSVLPTIAWGATNYTWTATASTSGATIQTEYRTKLTTSSVIANYSSGGSTELYAKVYAHWHLDTSRYTDVTYYSSSHPNYRIPKSYVTYVDVLNTAHETYGDCNVQLRFQTNASGTHSGKWRPDA